MRSVSVAVMTFHRTTEIKRVIKEYLEQDYQGPKELIILNDDPYVEYVYNHPEIKIHNWSYRFRTHYLKQDKLVELCNNELVVFWSDDDACKPWAISTMMRYLGGEDPFLHIGSYYKKKGNATSPVQLMLMNEAHAGNYIITKKMYLEMGGHGHAKADTELMDRIIKHEKYRIQVLPKHEIFYTWCVDRNRRKGVWEVSPEEDYHFDLHRKPEIISLK